MARPLHVADLLWLAQLRPNRLDHLVARREDTKGGQRPAIEDWLAIEQYLELAVGSSHHLDLCVKFAPQFRRHTDGVQPGHSVGARPDLDSSHRSSYNRCRAWNADFAAAWPPNAPLQRRPAQRTARCNRLAVIAR